MPWKESSVMDERLRFVARLLEGEQMSLVCREFGIWRKTGYKVFERYKEHGLEALSDRCRRPVRYANQLPAQSESLILSLKRDKPHWGARKLRELLLRRLAGEVRVPARSTIHCVLARYGAPDGALAHGCATAELHHETGRDPCLKYVPLPMSPGWTEGTLAETEGFEPSIRLITV